MVTRLYKKIIDNAIASLDYSRTATADGKETGFKPATYGLWIWSRWNVAKVNSAFSKLPSCPVRGGLNEGQNQRPFIRYM